MRKCLFTAMIILFGNVLSSSACAHALPLNSLAITACQTKEKSQACQYADHHNDLYLGTCQLVTETQLICVRNKPIQKADKDNVKHPIMQKIDTTAEQNEPM